MSKRNAQEWKSRRQIPDPQIKDAADQYEAGRQLLDKQPPESGVLLPLMNASTVAIELYLKCLSAEKVHVPTNDGWGGCMVNSEPAWGHILTELFDKIPDDVRSDLTKTFAESQPAASNSLRDMLTSVEGAFMTTRYPFEAGANISSIDLRGLMLLSYFLHEYVARLTPRETIQWK
jgi:hypothetical protein